MQGITVVLISILIFFLHCSYKQLLSGWPTQFHELDWASQVTSIVYQRIFPNVSRIEDFRRFVPRKRLLLRLLSWAHGFTEPSFPHVISSDEYVYDRSDQNSLRLRVYRQNQGSSGLDAGGNPVVLWFHGGGWISGTVDQDDSLCKRLVSENKFIVVSIDYRLAPEFVFPSQIDDAIAALTWIGKSVAKFGGDAGNVILAGESAGGHLAAALMLSIAEYSNSRPEILIATKISGLMLIYPVLNHTSVHNKPESPLTGMLSVSDIENMRSMFAGDFQSPELLKNNFLFAPLVAPAELLARFPPTLVVVAKHDCLAPEALQFVSKLRRAEVETSVHQYNRSIHIFFGRWPFSEGLLALSNCILWLREKTAKN